MATYYQQYNIRTATGPAWTLAPDDIYNLFYPYTILDQDPLSPAIVALGKVEIYVSGTVAGHGGAVSIAGAPNSRSSVQVNSTGTIRSVPTTAVKAALRVGGQHEIWLSYSAAVVADVSGALGAHDAAIETTGPGGLMNYGFISGATGVKDLDATAGDRVSVVNFGRIIGAGGVAFDGTNSRARQSVLTYRLIEGRIEFNDAADDYFENRDQSSPSQGAVVFGDGARARLVNVYPGSTLGAVTFGAGDHDALYNFGRMPVSPVFGAGADDFLLNAGAITSDLTLGDGARFVLDSRLGSISGTISCGSGGDTVVGPSNGGTIQGGAGDDILYANPTYATTTFLYGGGGSNALYGGAGVNWFMAGDTNGGYNQIWGGAGGTNILSFAHTPAGKSVYVDLLIGRNAYINSGANNDGAYAFEDSLVNVSDVYGSAGGDVILAGRNSGSIFGGLGADRMFDSSLYGVASAVITYGYKDWNESSAATGYDTISGFKIGTDFIDLTALHTDASHLLIDSAPIAGSTTNCVYVERTPDVFNAATDLALVVNTSTPFALRAFDFKF